MDELKETMAPTRPDPEPPSAGGVSAADHQKSFGERMFDLTVYGGIGYITNAAISLAITRYAVQKKGTALNQFSKITEGKFNQFFKLAGASPEKAKDFSEFSNNIFFLGSGGWALLVPMKWMEDHKLGIVREMDKLAGTGPQTPEAFLAQEQKLGSQAKQDYVSLFGGRLGSYLLTIFTALPFITETTTINARLNKFYLKKLDKHLGALREPLLVGERMPEFVDSLSKETILAGTAAALHYGGSKLIAHARHDESIPSVQVSSASHEQKMQSAHPLAAASSIT